MIGSRSLLLGGSPTSICDPIAPDGRAWLDEIAANPGYNSDPTPSDQAVWTTWLYDAELDAEEVLTFHTVLTTVRDGTEADLADQIEKAVYYYRMAMSLCCACCAGRVGDANGVGNPSDPDEPTIADVSAIIDFLFITRDPYVITCFDEADVNQSGGCCSNSTDVTIADVTILIDYLFITGASLGLPPCDWN